MTKYSIKALQVFTLMVGMLYLAAGQAYAEKRVALVIGNSDYQNASSLANPTNDADSMTVILSELGFEVSKIKDVSYTKMRLALRQFSAKAALADIALIFYAGHGMEVNKHNYLIPTDAKLASDRDIDFEAIPLDLLTQAAGGAKELSLVLLDACRNNPFAASMKRTLGTRSIGRGLAQVEPSAGTLVSFAAKEGTIANDGKGRNSPYTTALMKHLRQPGLEIQFLFRKVRDAVLQQTNGAQEPFTYGSLPGRRIYLVKSDDEPQKSINSSKSAEQSANNRLSSEQQLFWSSVHDSNDAALLQLYLNKYPKGVFAELAKLKIATLGKIDKTKSTKNSENSFVKFKSKSHATQQAFLYEEGTAGASASRNNGTIIWSLEHEILNNGNREAAIRGQLEVPERNLSMSLLIKRNGDEALPASHIIELHFRVPKDFSGGNIFDISRFVMKSSEKGRGKGLIAVPAKISDNNFLIALNNLKQATATNNRLILESSWIDLPLGYRTGRRALVTMEKGVHGNKVFRDAYAEWDRTQIHQ